MLVPRRSLSASSAAPAALCPRQHAHQHQHQHIRAQPCSVSLSPSCSLLHAGTLRAHRLAHLTASTLNPGNATAALVEELVKSGPATTPTRVTTTGRIVASEEEALGMRITLALRLRSCTGLIAVVSSKPHSQHALIRPRTVLTVVFDVGACMQLRVRSRRPAWRLAQGHRVAAHGKRGVHQRRHGD